MNSAKQLIKKLHLIQPTDKLLVAFSGGRDSVALAHFLISEGFQVAIAHVNYGLRSDDSKLDEKFSKQFAEYFKVKFHLRIVDPSEFENQNIQEKAREIRYAFFQELCEDFGYTKIVLGHHSADQMETFFLNLLRGTGINGLAGMPISRENIVRPLLETSRLEIDEYIKKHELEFREDVSNSSDKYTRNRIRHHLIPLLDDLLENGENRVKSSLSRIQTDVNAMSEMVKKLLIKSKLGWEIDLSSLPVSERGTWVYHILRDFGFNRIQCSDLVYSKPGAEIKSDSFTAAIFDQMLIVRDAIVSTSVQINSIGVYTLPNRKSLLIETLEYESDKMPISRDHIWMDVDNVHFPLTLRTISEEDRFQPLGSKYAVNVNRYLKDKHVNRLDRPQQLLLQDQNKTILWLLGIQLADQPKCSEKTKHVISLKIS